MTPARVVHVEAVGGSSTGLVRKGNEDSFAIGNLDDGAVTPPGQVLRAAIAARGPLFIVCDGMGGVAGGEIASELAVTSVWTEMARAAATSESSVYARQLRRAVRAANQRIWHEGRRGKYRGMGTTVSAAGVVGDVLLVAQVGDSRVYIHRAGTLTQVTRDQSVLHALLHSGRVDPADAALRVAPTAILQAVGVEADVEVALSIAVLRRGDLLLLCSDGLHGVVAEAQICEVLGTGARAGDLSVGVERLLALALEAGGPDNVTAVLARFEGAGLAEPQSAELPVFTEYDPMEQGEEALSSTSRVARRLAARVGLGESAPPLVPATGQHQVLGETPAPRQSTRTALPVGPATLALARMQRLGLLPWLVASALLLALLLWLVWDSL